MFLSGSDTSGNALFGNLQVVAARQLNLNPLLFAATDQADLLVFDALTGRLNHDEKKLGQTPQLLLNP